MDNFGAYLRAHREKKGIRLEEIASITKIHIHSLELLESSKWKQLPPEPFIRGFIVAYAKYVGLSTSEVLNRYKEATGIPLEVASNDPLPTTQSPTPAVLAPTRDLGTQFRLPSGPKMITAMSLIAVVGLAAILINVGREAEDRTSVPVQVTMVPETPPAPQIAQNPKEEERKVAVAPAPNSKPETVTPASTQAILHEVVIEGKERTWIKVVIDENQPTEYFLPEGKAVTYKATNKIKVVLGNSTGSRVLYNGKEMDGKQFLGTIRTYKFPETARFPQDTPSKRTPTTEGSETPAAPF
jgi:cytoskeleton protein RodZ